MYMCFHITMICGINVTWNDTMVIIIVFVVASWLSFFGFVTYSALSVVHVIVSR